MTALGVTLVVNARQGARVPNDTAPHARATELHATELRLLSA